MKTMVFCVIACMASAICTPIHAEQLLSAESGNDNASALVAVGAKLPRATNTEVVIGNTTGQIVAFDAKGYVMKSNVDYLPRVALTNVTDTDFHVMLESKTVYDALTIFGLNSPRTTGSPYFEERLRDIWLRGNSLSEKIQTRMALLDEMRAYNDSVAAYATSVGFADNASTIEKNANDAQQNDSTTISNSTQLLLSANSRFQFHVARRDLRQASTDLDNQVEAANGAATMSTAMQQRADTYRKICAQYADQLAQHDIRVAAEPPFTPIPPLSMRLEVDMERVAPVAGAQTASSSR